MKMHFDRKFIDDVIKDFKEELNENINLAENIMIDLEENSDTSTINTLMRSFHSIKGVSRLLLSMDIPEKYIENAQKIEKVSHALEDYVVEFGNNIQNKTYTEIIYDGIDILRSLSKAFSEMKESPDISEFLDKIKNKNNTINKKLDIDPALKVFLNILSQFFEYLEKMEEYNNSQLERMYLSVMNALKRLKREDLIQQLKKIMDFALIQDRNSVEKSIEEFNDLVFDKKKKTFQKRIKWRYSINLNFQIL
ncbi:hypothetical protein [Marinitoga lauensis]|uniref:hypothetical protein n=1 Tax=Marinitoga lauensis TaxID=2201189 RepID=UPI0010107D3A|nr:hypothetical protein [Marinitoga lauensis]